MTTPNVKMRGDSRISKSGAWTAQQLIDLRSIWDDVIRSVNGGVLPKDYALPDDTEITPAALPTDVNVQVNTQVAGNLTIHAPNGTPANGQFMEIVLKSSAAQTFVWDAIYAGCTTTALPVASTGGGATDKFFFQYNSTSLKWEIYNAQFGY